MFLKVINIQLNLFTSAVLGPKNVAVVERKPMSKGSETRVRVWTVLQKVAVVERWPLVEVRLYISFVGFCDLMTMNQEDSSSNLQRRFSKQTRLR